MSYGIKTWNIYSQNIFPSPTNIFNWCSTAGTNNCTFLADTSIAGAVSGSVPLKMTVTGSDPHIGTYNSRQWTLDVAEIGDTFTVSCYVRGSLGGYTGQLYIFGVDDSGNYTSTNDFSAGSFNITTSWTRVSFTYTMTGTATRGIQIRLDGPDNYIGSHVWFDGLQLEQGNIATTFTPTPASTSLVHNMLGGRVFIETIILQPDQLPLSQPQTITYVNVPGHIYLKYYIVQAGPYEIVASTNLNNQAQLTFTRYAGNDPLVTVILVFALKTTESDYGIVTVNSAGERIVSNIYTVPVYLGKVVFNPTPNTSYGLTRYHTTNLTYGNTDSYKLVLYTIPESDNVWFWGTSIVYPNQNPYTVTTAYILPSASTTYSLAEGFVFQLNNITSNNTHGLRLWNSAQQLLFDSGLQHINLVNQKHSIIFNTTERNYSGYSNYEAIILSEYVIAEATAYGSGSIYKQSRGVYRRKENVLYTKIVEEFSSFFDYPQTYYNSYGSQINDFVLNINTLLLGSSGTGGYGSSTLSATIIPGDGNSTCSYSTSYATSCTTIRTYNISTSGGNGTTITYNWSIPENSGGFELITGSNFAYAQLRKTGSNGTYVCVLRCVLTQSGISLTTEYLVTHTHTTSTATYSISASSTTINEGQSVTFTVTTTNVPNNTFLYATLNPAVYGDFIPDVIEGSINIINGTAAFSLQATSDYITEGNETFSINLRTGSVSGPIVATSQSITVVDTSNNETGWSLYLNDGSTQLNTGTTKTLVFSYSEIVSLPPTYSFTSSNSNLTISPSSGTMGGTLIQEPGDPNYNKYRNITISVSITASIISGNQSATITAYSPSGTTLRKTLQLTINDVYPPTVTLTPANSSINTSQSTNVTITTSESTNNLTSTDISVSTGSISNFTGSGTSYSFTYTAPATAATVTLSIAAGAFTDSNGNSNTFGSTTITVLQPDPVYTNPVISNLSVSPSTIDENNNRLVTFYFDLTDNAISGAPRLIYSSIEGVSGVITTADFDGNLVHQHISTAGTVQRSKIITIKTDLLTEGTEQFRLNFYSQAAYTSNPQQAPYYQSGSYSIQDTSLTPYIPPRLTQVTVNPNPITSYSNYTITVTQNKIDSATNNLDIFLYEKNPSLYTNYWPGGTLIKILANNTTGSFSSVLGNMMQHNALLTASGALSGDSTDTVSTWVLIGGTPSVGVSWMSFNVTNTNYATQNTVNTPIYLRANQTIEFGTLNVGKLFDTSLTGDSYLRILRANGETAVVADDYTSSGSTSLGTYISWPVDVEGEYTLVIGAWGSVSASGIAAYCISYRT